jgi:hypothetical protein
MWRTQRVVGSACMHDAGHHCNQIRELLGRFVAGGDPVAPWGTSRIVLWLLKC